MNFVIENGVLAEIDGGGEPVRHLEIPEGVTRIGRKPGVYFKRMLLEKPPDLESVVIPEGVTVIGRSAFDGCTNLKAVLLPGSLQKIEGYAFRDCGALTEITVPDTVTVDNSAFRGCCGMADESGFFILRDLLCCYVGSHTQVTVPDGVREIGDGAFADNQTLETVIIPDSVTELWEAVFENCTSLKEIHLSGKTKVIPSRMFAGCTGLNNLEIPGSVKFLEWEVFSGCKNLAWVRIQNVATDIASELPRTAVYAADPSFSGWTEIENGKLWKTGTGLYHLAPAGQIPFRILMNERLAHFALDKKGNLNRKVYDNVLEINEAKLPSALQALAMLYRLRFPEELTDSRREAFVKVICQRMKKLAPYLGAYPEDDLVSLLEEIGAITEKTKKSILILAGLEKEEPGQEKAPSKKGKKAEKSAGGDGIKTLAQLKEEWSFKKLQDGTLCLISYKGNDTAVEVPVGIGKNRVSTIGNDCMGCCTWARNATEEKTAQCGRITSVTIPEGITQIGDDAFYDCKNLETVALPSTLKTIGSRAFQGCVKLQRLIIPEGVEAIGEGAFRGCSDLQTVTLPTGSITIGSGAFERCTKLADDQGMIILNNILFQCIRGENIVVPDSVAEIAEKAFAELPNLKSIVFPDGLKTLPSRAVYRCRNLKAVTIPPSVISIHALAFDGCRGLRIYGFTGSQADRFCDDNWGAVTFESVGVLEENQTDFVITDGVLTRYRGQEAHVEIPPDIREISDQSTGGAGAFAGNAALESVVIPEGVERILHSAFRNCRNLHRIEIPDSVVETDKFAFEYSPWFEKQKDTAVYAGRVLIHFGETGVEEYAVREGTVRIANGAFHIKQEYETLRNPSLKKIILPEGLTHIGEFAFGSCCNLEELQIPSSVTCVAENALFGIHGLKHCRGGVLHKKEKLSAVYRDLYTGDPEDTAWLVLYQQEQSWCKRIREKMEANPENIGAAMKTMAQLIDGMEALDKAAGNRAAAFALEQCAAANAEALQALYQALKHKNHPAVKKLDQDNTFRSYLVGNAKEDLDVLHPVEAMVVQNLKYTPGFKKVLERIVEGVPYSGTEEICGTRVLAFLVYEYIHQHNTEGTSFLISAAADEAAAALDSQKLQEALLQLAELYGEEYWIPFARYADDRNTVALLSKIREWNTWSKYGAKGRNDIFIARKALLLNDTKAAMLYMDQIGWLDTYASLRCTDAETIRDTVLADFGFDENRQIRYDLGGNTAVVRIAGDLSLTIFDTNAGKIVKSIPQKGADAMLLANAKTALSALKKNIKKVLTNRRHILFADFLSGAEKDAVKWKQSYLGNPVLNSIARLIVWGQGDTTFTLTENGAVDCTGAAYEVSQEPIRVAHPMEMGSELADWQHYFRSNCLKQPFEQIWEPAYDPAQILQDRYEGCSLNVYRLTNKEQHGIQVWGLRDYSEDYGFKLTDCEMTYKPSHWRFVHGVTDDAVFELGKFTFSSFTRYVNHIVYLFDKWTITNRLLKDDVAVEPLLDAFTAAQIREFIRLTAENGCINCSAMLLNYQFTHFGDFDPMEEFTLDL